MDGLTDEMGVDRERRVASSRRKKAFEDAESVQKKGKRGGESPFYPESILPIHIAP